MKRTNSRKPRVVDIVRGVAAPFCKENGLIFEDVEFVKEGPHRYLRIIIDKKEGVALDDCQNLSRFLNKELDKLDPIEENYFLEVTSPGLERELKKDSDYERFAGRKVQANLFNSLNGKKIIKGTLMGLESGIVIIDTKVHGIVEFPKDKISVIRLLVDFEDLDDVEYIDEIDDKNTAKSK